MTTPTCLLMDVHEGVATITLNRPKSMNAVDGVMRLELHDAWRRVREDDGIRVAVLTGAGDKAFCTGSDLKNTPPNNDSIAAQTFGSRASRSMTDGLNLDKPLIAAINGYAIGGGLEIALACDIRICSDNATFALSEVKVGSIPGAGGTQRLPRAIGLSDAMLMMLTGDRIDATEALRIGLVSKVVPQSALLPTATDIAARIAGNAPLAVRAAKRLVRQGLEMPLEHALQAERQAFGLLYNSGDRIEGRKAFAEKRKPNFKGI